MESFQEISVGVAEGFETSSFNLSHYSSSCYYFQGNNDSPKEDGDEIVINEKPSLPSEPDTVISTESNKLFEHLTTVYYIPMEIWYTRTIIDKVHSFFCAERYLLNIL